MRISSIRTVVALTTLVGAALFSVGTLQAQPTTRAGAAERREKLKNMTPEERKAALEKAKANRKEHAGKLSDAQKAWAKSEAAEVKSIRDGVKAGTLTKETAAAQLKAWRAANPRPTS